MPSNLCPLGLLLSVLTLYRFGSLRLRGGMWRCITSQTFATPTTIQQHTAHGALALAMFMLPPKLSAIMQTQLIIGRLSLCTHLGQLEVVLMMVRGGRVRLDTCGMMSENRTCRLTIRLIFSALGAFAYRRSLGKSRCFCSPIGSPRDQTWIE